MKFKLFANNELIGEFLLENGDPPMGVVFGEMVPNTNYSKYQPLFEARNVKEIESLNLVMTTDTGETLKSSGGIGIEDYTNEMGERSIQVTVFGIESSVYMQLFPDLIAAYEEKFR